MFGIGRYFIIFTLLAVLIFPFFPEIDIWFTNLFYDGSFYLNDRPWVQFFYRYAQLFAVVVGIISLISLIVSHFRKKEHFGVKKVVWAYLLLVLLVGPGLVVNIIFKDNWGRARPHQTEIFGGNKTFTPAFVMTDQCNRNCSFSSGHAAAGFFFIALALMARKNRTFYLSLAILFGAMIGFGRIVQGAHFLSDVVFSFIFVYIVANVLYHVMLKRDMQV